MPCERSVCQAIDSQQRSHSQPSGQHQTSINAIMGPGPNEPNEHTKLLSTSRDSTNSYTGHQGLAPARTSTGHVGFFTQVQLLLWKNLLLQKRSIVVTVAEVLIPLLGALIMLIVRRIVAVENTYLPTTYNATGLAPTMAVKFNPFNGIILFAPNETFTDQVMNDVKQSFHRYGLHVNVQGFESEDELVKFYRQQNSNTTMMYPISVIFDIPPDKKDLTFTLRPATLKNDKWQTQFIFSFYQVLAPRNITDDLYYKRGFVFVQHIVSEAIIHQLSNRSDNLNNTSWWLNQIPYPPYFNDPMVQVLQQNFPTIIMLSFILSVIIMTKNIVYEKERQLKESMKLMGMSAAAHWTSWFLQFFIYLLCASAIYTLFLSIKIGDKTGDKLPVLSYSDPSLIFVFLLIYSFSIITYCFFISTLVSKANVGAALAGIIFFAVFFPYFFLEQQYQDLTRNTKLGLCFLFNMAMCYGIKTIGLYEGTGKGAQWDSFTEPASIDDNFSLLHAMLMLIADSFIFLVLTWYIDNVRPGIYGVPRPWYFPLQPSYWCGGVQMKNKALVEAQHFHDDSYFEREPSGLNIGISMVHLCKEFAKNKVAVKDSTLNMYEGQITVLLGHNGAGKTTTMSMLTGFLPPSSGTAYVNGYDIRTDISNVRSNLGLCPQHNILFEKLTVDEHLEFFAKLKGLPKAEVEQAVDAMATEVGLETKRGAYASTLSGGQKRKLSVGIALIGGSKIVILDEPTSGMDPAARRQTWDVLQRHRQGRTLLLSTHFMDEADLLGDRIAIMAEGVVKCCGTSMFLKKTYGAGYHLVIVRGPQCVVDMVTKIVQTHVPGAQLESEVGAELSYLLPDDQARNFPQLFRIIETQSQELGISSFGATATTMEEVFLKVGASGLDEEKDVETSDTESTHNYTTIKGLAEGAEVKVVSKATNRNGQLDTVINATSPITGTEALMIDYTRLTGTPLELSRFWGMFVKKAIHTWRNTVISTVQLALPVLFTIAALTVDKVRPKNGSEPPITLNMGMFDGSISAYSTGISATNLTKGLGSHYQSLFSGKDQVNFIDHRANTTMNGYFLGQAESLGLFTYNKKVVIGADFEEQTNGMSIITAWFSGQPYHVMPAALAYVMNAVARQVTGENITMTVINHPMPKEEVAAAQDELTMALMLGFSIGFSMLFGMSFLTASFSYFLIRERQTNAKHLQVVSGVGPFSYWLASMSWDFVNYLIPCLVLLVVFAAFQVDAYTEDSNLGLVFLVLIIFGLAVIPFVYLLQSMFVTPATGFVVLIILAIISGLFTMMTVFIMRIPSLKVVDVAEVLDWLFMIFFPHYSLGMGFSNFYVNKLDQDFCQFITCPTNGSNPCCKGECDVDGGGFCLPHEDNILSWEYPGIGRNLFFMAIQAVVFFSIILAIDYQVPQKIWYFLRGKDRAIELPVETGIINPALDGIGEIIEAEDSDVVTERQRVNLDCSGNLSDTLILHNLYKQYDSFVAVDQISVGIPEQECFGLLGQNGAGKTTTFKMLTGDIMVSSGDAFVRGNSIKTDIKRVQANMGYCPQFDALIDQMTGRETLYMYARLRGVPASHIRRVVENLISLLMLEQHADKLTLHYSGGNKRKLSTAISLVGGPAVVLLDEPSSGMDPAARRQLWNVLSQVRASGRTLVLTSHSMEECDALCTRIAIMVNGQFKCLGSPQHLKSKFGQGYTLVAKMAMLSSGQLASTEPLIEEIFRLFPGTQKFDDHQGYVHFQVPDASVPLSEVFAAMERAKSEFKVEDYSVHQTTLEQIFLTFTRIQHLSAEPHETDRSILSTGQYQTAPSTSLRMRHTLELPYKPPYR